VNVVAIIQARMGSTRLPGKVMKDICGKPMLERIVDRVLLSHEVNKVVVATSNLNKNDVICDFCNDKAINVYRGSEKDVLGRYYKCATKNNADVVVRITADCPFVSPRMIDDMISLFLVKECDFVSNVMERTFPKGLDLEVFSMNLLQKTFNNAISDYDREHVTPYMYNPTTYIHDEDLSFISFEDDEDFSKLRFTVDLQSDLDFTRKVYEHFGTDFFEYGEIIESDMI